MNEIDMMMTKVTFGWGAACASIFWSLVPPLFGRLCLHVVFRDAVSKFF